MFKKAILNNKNELEEIPENIQKHIEAREKYWFDKIKEIDEKCGVLLERLALTEKALELACEELAETKMIDIVIQNGYISGEPKDIANYFKNKAKEMSDE